MCEVKINNDIPNGVAVTRKCKQCGETEKFKDFSDRDLINELRSRGWAGTLRYTKVEEIDL